MAIYHLSVKPIKRSDGRSAVAAAAYRAGERLRDERTGLLYDYSHRKEEARIESWVQVPEEAPAWTRERMQLWNEAEAAERRKDGRPAREVEVALPVELDRDQQNDLLRGFVRDELVGRGVAADVCVHRGDQENPHAHVMVTTREVGADGFVERKARELDRAETTQRWREEWARHQNRELERAGWEERVDHRSNRIRGIDREPTLHDGPQVRSMEARGIRTDRGEANRDVRERNAERERERQREASREAERERAMRERSGPERSL